MHNHNVLPTILGAGDGVQVEVDPQSVLSCPLEQAKDVSNGHSEPSGRDQ